MAGGATIEDVLRPVHVYLRGLEAEIRDHVLQALGQREAGQWAQSDDDLFAAFNAYVLPACLGGFPSRAIHLWLTDLQFAVERAEAKAGHIHKGAPLYNTGLCFFFAGDYRRAAQYIAAAGEEDEIRSPGGAKLLLTGGGFAEQLLVNPLASWLELEFGADYKSATGKDLSKSEFPQLVNHLAQRPPDAVLFLSAIHGLSWQVKGPDNGSSRLQRIRSLADLLVVFESSLRRWISPTPRDLYSASQTLLRQNGVAFATFNARQAHYAAANIDLRTTAGVNALLRLEPLELDKATTVSERAGIAAFVGYRLRNAVLHVADENLDLFTDPKLLLRVFGFAIACVRLSQHGAEGTISTL